MVRVDSQAIKEKRKEILEHQIIFRLRPLSKKLTISPCGELRCRTEIGQFRNAIGDFILRPNNIYAFSFVVISGTKFKIGVVDKLYVDSLLSSNKKMKGAFTEEGLGAGVFSYPNSSPKSGSKKNSCTPLSPCSEIMPGLNPPLSLLSRNVLAKFFLLTFIATLVV